MLPSTPASSHAAPHAMPMVALAAAQQYQVKMSQTLNLWPLKPYQGRCLPLKQ